MGLLQSDPEEWFAGGTGGELSADEIESLLEERKIARANRDFAAADSIRDKLSNAGIVIEDGADGARWRRS
jgi:cysteinyl-tRNA synthetase